MACQGVLAGQGEGEQGGVLVAVIACKLLSWQAKCAVLVLTL